MNETLQQFCQRILPVVQAGAEGKEIEFKYSRVNDSWNKKEGCGFGKDFEYRIAKPKATPLPITPEMWAMIDPRCKWAVMTNESDVLFIGGGTPKHDGNIWLFPDLEVAGITSFDIDTTGIVPELSLTERPSDDDLSSEDEDNDDFQLISVGVNVCGDPICAALDEMIKSFIKAASEASADEEQQSADAESDEPEKELKSGKSSATHRIGNMLYKKIGDFWCMWDEQDESWQRSTLPSQVIVHHAKKLN